MNYQVYVRSINYREWYGRQKYNDKIEHFKFLQLVRKANIP